MTEVGTERCDPRDCLHTDEPRVLDMYSRWEVARWLGATPRTMEPATEAARFVERCSELNRSEPVSRLRDRDRARRAGAYYDTESELFRVTRSEQG
jgi:hypothetical protein